MLPLGDGVIDLMIRARESFTGLAKLVPMTAVKSKVIRVFVASID